MQFLREKNFKQTIPQLKVEDGEEVTYEATTAAVKRSVHLFSALQSKDGHWPAENAGPMFYFPPLVIPLQFPFISSFHACFPHLRVFIPSLQFIFCMDFVLKNFNLK